MLLLTIGIHGNASGKQENSDAKKDVVKRNGKKLTQILVEPCDCLIHSIGLVLRVYEKMTFAWVNDQLGRHAKRLQRMPEFVGLRRRAFRVALTDNDEGSGLYVFDKPNGRAFLIRGGIVVN